MKIRLRNRTKLFSFVMLASLLAVFVIFRATSHEVYRPTIINFDKIKGGMTESEVEAILGRPHKVLTSESSRREFYRPDRPEEKVYVYYGANNDENGFETYHVFFDVNGQVCGSGASGRKRTFFEKIRDWLKTCLF